MPNYKRVRIKGGCYFFTVNLANRASTLLTQEYTALCHAMTAIKRQRPFWMPGWVILPDHLHCLWVLPDNDDDYSGRWRAIKTLFSKNYRLRNMVKEEVWQKRFWEHTIRNDIDFEKHLEYIHINPLKHGLVERVRDWPYSSFHYYVKKRRVSLSWGGEEILLNEIDAGERR